MNMLYCLQFTMIIIAYTCGMFECMISNIYAISNDMQFHQFTCIWYSTRNEYLWRRIRDFGIVDVHAGASEFSEYTL